MTTDREALLEKLLGSYTRYFDIERIENRGGLSAIAEYHSRSEKYVLVKRAQLWAAENHEYTFFYSVPRLNHESFETLKKYVVDEGLRRITPHSEHMFSYITAIILSDTIDPGIHKVISGCRYSKNFKLSFHGWASLRVAAVDLEGGDVKTNSAGKDVGKFVRKICEE